MPPDREKIANDREKEGKILEEGGKIGKRGKNWEEKAKIGKVLSLCPPDREGWLHHGGVGTLTQEAHVAGSQSQYERPCIKCEFRGEYCSRGSILLLSTDAGIYVS